jgi:hypothetical protein
MRLILSILFAASLVPVKASDGAAPDFSNYPHTQWFTSHVYWQTNALAHLPEKRLLWLTEFPCGDGSAFQSYVAESGREYMGLYTELATYGGHYRELSTNQLQALRSALRELPSTNASPPIESLVVLSFREGTNWITRTYDTDALPKPMGQIYRIMEIKWQRAFRVK